MKPLSKFNFIVILAFTINCFINVSIIKAQGSAPRLSASVQLGLPVTYFSVPSKPVGIYTAALRYSYSRNWSFEARVTSNTFYNNATGHSAKTILDNTATDIASYRTPVYGFNAIAYYNLHKVLNLDSKPQNRFLPYLSLGAGINMYRPEVSYVNGTSSKAKTFGKPYRDFQLGLGTRYFINSNLDLFAGAEYHISETYYLDGFKELTNPSLDQYLNFYGGLSVKFGAKPWNNLIDWNHKNSVNPNEETKSYAKFALDAGIGLPYLFTSVGHKATGMYNLGLRYSFNRAIGLQVNFAQGKVAGEQKGNIAAADNTPESINSFTTGLSQFTLRAYFNVLNLLEEKVARPQWNHYLILGAGYLKATGDATLANGKSVTGRMLYKEPGIQNIVIGYEARKYYNSYFDLIAGLDFSYNQSKYLDQAGSKPNLNNHLYFHTGITYKIGATKEKEHIDWSYKNYNHYRNKKSIIEQELVLERPPAAPRIDTSRMVVNTIPTPAPVDPVKTEVAPNISKENVIVPIIETPVPAVVEPIQKVEAPKEIVVAIPEEIKKSETVPTVKPAEAPVLVAPKVIKPVAPKVVENVVPKPVIIDPSLSGNTQLAPPKAKYNVVVACYSVNRIDAALAYQQILLSQGYKPVISKSNGRSKIVRMTILTTDNRKEALAASRKARRSIESQAWLYLYNKQ